MVVGNRMAFFCDAMAHCAFAGVSLGYLSVLAGRAGTRIDGPGRAAGHGCVRMPRSGWGWSMSATRPGSPRHRHRRLLRPGHRFRGDAFSGSRQVESDSTRSTFIFGNLVLIPDAGHPFPDRLRTGRDAAVRLAVQPAGVRELQPDPGPHAGDDAARCNNYLFIVLLALVVNLSIKAVGALLINALLVVPAAAAANLSRNLRQMFWLTVAFCVASGMIGFALRNSFEFRVGSGEPVAFGPSGVIVVTSVLRCSSARWSPRRSGISSRPSSDSPPCPARPAGTFTTRLVPTTMHSDNVLDRHRA